MVRGRIRTVRERGLKGLLMVAEVHDSDGRLVWTDNTRFGTDTLRSMFVFTASVVDAVRFLESLGHRLEWSWQECVDHAPRL